MSVPRFWREIPQRYKMMGTRCRGCKGVFFPPRIVCPVCKEALKDGRTIMEDAELSGKGKIKTYTIIHVGPPEFAGQTPYAMAIIELEEGTSITGQVIDCNLDEVKIGMPVQAVFKRISTDGAEGVIYYGYKFRPL
ncbi:MAG: Zn-ribbon domain-containing OB-fold protein [archaeon]